MAKATNGAARLYSDYDRHPGDRQRLFSAVAGVFPVNHVLYPGSYIDIAPSIVFPAVTYVDTAPRARRFFGDRHGVEDLIGQARGDAGPINLTFLHADYTDDLDLPLDHFDLLLSLYAGLVSPTCTRYLRPGGWLLATNGHGDASMASLNPAYRLVAVVTRRPGRYRISAKDLDSYLIPRKDIEVRAELLRSSRRGVAFTTTPFAYVFQRLT